MNLQEKIKNGWNISAEGYSKRIVQDDFIPPGRDIWTDLVLSKAPKQGTMDILDVGTGPGVFTTILTLAGHHLTGIDISPNMLEQAVQNSARFKVSPEYLLMDSQNVTFEENSFDMVISRNVVWIMEFPRQAYQNWLRILRPGGRLVVFDTGHGSEDFLTQFDHNHQAYIADYKHKFGVDPPLSFEPGQYEAARGWKRELKLSHESRPQWDAAALKQLGYENITWDDVAQQASYTEALKYENRNRIFFRLCADKPC